MPPSTIAEEYAKWDKFVEDVNSEDEDERLRQENIEKHETYRKWQWEQKQQQQWDPMSAKRVNFENIGGNNSENGIKRRMKAKRVRKLQTKNNNRVQLGGFRNVFSRVRKIRHRRQRKTDRRVGIR